jgi:hypothetical protein
VFASAVLQDVLGTARTFLCLLLDGRERCVFLVGAVFDAELVLSARFVLVPWAVAWDAGFAAAFVACEDALEVLLPLMLLLLLSLPPLPQPLQIPEKFLVVLLDELLLLKWLMRCNIPRPLHNVLGPTTRDYGTIVVDVDLLGMPWTSIIDILARPIAWDVHLSSATAWSQTPAPPRSILSSVNSLQLNIPSKRLRQQPNRQKNNSRTKITRTTNLAKSFFVTAPSTSSLPIFCSHSGHAIRGVKTLVSICDSTHSFRQRLHVLIMCSHVEVGLLSGNCEEMRLTMHVWHS